MIDSGQYLGQLELSEDDHELRDKLQLMMDGDAWKYVDKVMQGLTMEALRNLTRRQATHEELRYYQGKAAALEELQQFLLDMTEQGEEDEN